MNYTFLAGAVMSCSLANSWWPCLPNGMDDNPINHRQPRLSSTSQARPASKQLPRVQKASSQMSQTPLPLVGMNSMYSVKDTGTPPRPRPTQKRKKINHCMSSNFHTHLMLLKTAAVTHATQVCIKMLQLTPW